MKRNIFLFLILLIISQVVLSQKNIIKKKFLVKKQYVLFPVNNDGKKYSIDLKSENFSTYFDIKLASHKDSIDYWVFTDVGRYENQKIVIQSENKLDLESAFSLIHQSNVIESKIPIYSEELRPQIHFTSKRGWLNDPNGLVYYDGEYHLFYQHNPYDWSSGNKHWGHAISTDLIHWKELESALVPDEKYSIWSGSVVVDYNNSSDFKTGKENVLVAAYTAAGNSPLNKDIAFQYLAFSNDKGRTWSNYEKNPVIGDLREKWGTRHIRDPKIFWYKPGGHWVMVLFEQLGHTIYTSNNLKEWTYQSHTEGFYECPELFELAVDGNPENTKWVMYGASGSYAIGDFDGQRFYWESGKHRYKSGKLYAAQTFNNIPESDGRRIQMAWGRISFPGMPFNQMMLFPTKLSLQTTSRGIRLHCEPIEEIEKLHTKKYQWNNLSKEAMNEKLKVIDGDKLHIKCEIETIDSPKFGLMIDGNKQICDILNGDFFNDAPYVMDANSKTIKLEIIVDKTSIETFVDGGRLYYIMAKDLNSTEKGIEFWTIGKDNKINIKNLEIYELKTIWD